jgi:2,4-dienoyl-CoA reductase-like NADH-dependent reductase (Old Yellow Enzyme family)
VQDYKKSAELAKTAGFDGVEIHGANGYLIDQFLQSSSNKRTDKYGGSIENRYRFLSEIVEAIEEVYPSNHIGIRLSPNGSFGGMGSEDNFKTFSYVIEQLSKHNLSYLALLDGFGFGYHDKDRLFTLYDAKILFKGPVVAQNSYTRDIAEGAVRSGAADAVGFGRLYISNPDLAERFENDWPLNPDANYDDFWNSSRGPSGYIDFPAYKDSIRK